jgi:GntR family transcriptional regulator
MASKSSAAPVLRIDLSSAVPVYLQIVAQLRALLVSGRLAAGHRLPSVRQLAADLGVHHNTVALAYRQLAEEGWLELRQGRGASVLPRPEPKASAEAEAEFSRRLEGLVAKAAADGLNPEAISREFEALRRKLWKGKKS